MIPAIFILSIVDYLQTVAVLSAGGIELNPVASWLMAQGGMVALTAKMMVTAMLCVLIAFIGNRLGERYAVVLGAIPLALLTLAVLNNFVVLWVVLR